MDPWYTTHMGLVRIRDIFAIVRTLITVIRGMILNYIPLFAMMLLSILNKNLFFQISLYHRDARRSTQRGFINKFQEISSKLKKKIMNT